MMDVQAAIYSRLTGDTTDKNGTCLQNLLGSSGRIFAGLDYQLAQAPCITFNGITNIPGHTNADTVMTEEQRYVFRIFANNFFDIAYRLKQLLDRYVFAATSKAGVLKCVWEDDGPELFDEDLKVRRRDSRYKIYVMPKAIGPV